jgi:hypothetical protein
MNAAICGPLGEKAVDPTSTHDNWNDIILFAPLVALLIFGYFRVDEIFGPKRNAGTGPRPSRPAADPGETSWMSDPDGRPWT